MPLNKSKIRRILVISLTNIGDVVLTFPVVDILKEQLPHAEISLVIGPKAGSLFHNNPYLHRIYVFDKHQGSAKTLKWIMQLRGEGFDLVVDLRNTAIPFLINAGHKTSFVVRKDRTLHMKQKHLNRLHTVFPFDKQAGGRYALYMNEKDQSRAQQLIDKEVGRDNKFVVIAPGAASEDKRWSEEGFAGIADFITAEGGFRIVLIGDSDDRAVAERIAGLMPVKPVNLCGKTNLIQSAALLDRCAFAVVNDSAPMHLASYLNKPVLAVFITTDPVKYGPWSDCCRYVRAVQTGLAASGGRQVKPDPKSLLPQTVLEAFTLTAEGIEFKPHG